MGWLSSITTAVTKAVSTAVTAVKNVATAVVSSVSKSVASAASAVKSVVSSVASKVADTASKARESTASAKKTAAETAKKATETSTKATTTATETAVKEGVIVLAPPVPEPTLKDKILAFLTILFPLATIGVIDIANSIYKGFTGRDIGDEDLPNLIKNSGTLNFMMVVDTGKDLKGERRDLPTLGETFDFVVTALLVAWGASALYKAGTKIAAKAGATQTYPVMKKVGETGAAKAVTVTQKRSIAGFFSAALKALWADAKKRPLMTLFLGTFALTEIPNYFNMRIFSRKTVAEMQGLAPSQVTFPLNEQDSHFKSLQYELGQAIKDGNYGKAKKILDDMKLTRDNFKKIVEEKAEVLKQIDMYETELTNLEYLNNVIERAEIEIAPMVKALQLELAESMKVRVREIVDGDTIRVRWDDGDVTLDVRLVGINAPEKAEKGSKESKDWLSKEIWGEDVTLLVDPARKRDQYDRILGVVRKAGEDINLKSVFYGWSFAYIREPNKYVDADEYLRAEATAKGLNRGVWALLVRVGTLGVSTSPTHAKIFLDGVDTGMRTAETIKNVPVGAHKIRVELEGYDSYEEDVEIKEDKKIEVFKKLVKEVIAVPPVEEEVPPEEVEVPEVLPTLEEFYDFLGTYVQEGKRLTRKEWEEIGKKYNLTQLGKAPEKAVSVQDLYLIVGDYVVGKAVLTEKEWIELEALLEVE